MEPEGLNQKMLLTVPETMQLLSLGRTKVYELIKSGELPVVRIGRLVRIRRADVERWIDGHRSRADEAEGER